MINGLNTFVPSFKSRNSGAIVITGSKQGITNPPGNPAYNASKAAVKTLAEHLSFDLKDTEIGVHLLVPGYTFTGLVSSLSLLPFHLFPVLYSQIADATVFQSGNVPNSTKPKPDSAWTGTQVADFMYQKMNDGKFYILCPDNDVTEELDKKRILWSVGDMVNGRPPLTRWRAEWKGEAEEWMAGHEM